MFYKGGDNVANEQNLKPIQEVNSNRTREQHSADSRKAGIASGKVRREKRTFKQAIEWLVNNDNIKIKKGMLYDTLKQSGIDISCLNPTQVATIGLWFGAVGGNATNYKTLMEANNEISEEGTKTPTLKIEVIDNGNLERTLYETNQSDKNDKGQ